MKLYLVASGPRATRFYLAADSPEELQRINRCAPIDQKSLGLHMQSTLSKLLGLDWTHERFVRSRYESDGVWTMELFGPANERLLQHQSIRYGDRMEDVDAKMSALTVELVKRLFSSDCNGKEAKS